MTFSEALRVLQKTSADASPFHVKLACGFTPLHLQTFLAAHLQKSAPLSKVTVTPGLFGDLIGTLESVTADGVDAVAACIEWVDLDPRLDYRGTAAWTRSMGADIVSNACSMLDRMAGAINRIPAGPAIAITLPSLPIPPLLQNQTWQAAVDELTLQRHIFEFAATVASGGRVKIVNPAKLAQTPLSSRLDLKAHLSTGLPYPLAYAAVLAELLAHNIIAPPIKKGIITDLDDTFWHGVIGDVGVDGVSWDLENHAQIHGLYQRQLALLAEQGILIAIASKNDFANVDKALDRNDLFLKRDRVFPMEVHWNPKSSSVTNILKTWNISADAAIVIDDSPMELAEIAQLHPQIECIRFPKEDPRQIPALLERLVELCGKDRVLADDAIRLESIRKGAEFRQQAGDGSASEEFLSQMNAVVTIDLHGAADPRALELVNKTNQFNLNGLRKTEPEWRQATSQPGSVTLVISYEDKFGPSGKISVLQGVADGATLVVNTWVMSCRVFARRIEHQCLQFLFRHFGFTNIRFEFFVSSKNGPAQEFFGTLLGAKPQGEFQLTKAQFEAYCPKLYHEVRSPNADE